VLHQQRGGAFGPAADDIQASQPPLLVKAGGGLTLAAGSLAILVAIQTITGFTVRALFFQLFLGVLAILGLAVATCGLMMLRVRPWAPIGAVVSSGLLFLATSSWLVMSISRGLISLFALGAPFASMVAIVMAAVSIGPVKRVIEARARLAGDLDLGV